MKSKSIEISNDHTSGIKPTNGWRFMKYESGANIDVAHSLYVKLKKKNSQIELSENQYPNVGFNITISKNTPNAYDSIRFLVKKRDEAIANIQSLMRILN